MQEELTKKIKPITDLVEGENDIYLKAHHNQSYIYNGKIRIRNGYKTNIYKPIKCSELYYKLDKFYKWFQYKYLIVENEDIYLVKNLPERFRINPIYYVNSEDLEDNKFNLTGQRENVNYNLSIAWDDLLNTVPDELEKANIKEMINSNEIFLLNNSKSTVDFLSVSNTITTELIDNNTYTDTVDIKPILSDKVFKNKTIRLDITVKYSINDAIYNYDITVKAFNINNETGKIEYNNIIQSIGKDLIRLEFLNGIIKIFPLSNTVEDCIISNCLITYGE